MERTAQEVFKDCLGLIIQGSIEGEERARELARSKGFSEARVDDAIRSGAEAMYSFYLSKIFSGHRGYENAARKLAEKNGLDLKKLEEALGYTKP